MYDFKLTNHGAHALVNLSPEKQISAITKFDPFDITNISKRLIDQLE